VVCRKLGIADVFRVNDPGRHRALGFGTDTIPKVRKIVGPGSPAVTLVQVEMQRHGAATMMLLGPTESLVIADDGADPVLLAADLVIEAVDAALERQLAGLAEVRATPATASLDPKGGCVLVESLDIAVGIANEFAPEHLQVAVADGAVDEVVDRPANSGGILVDQHTPFSAANFVIGCPASLPTSGFAHVSSGITADTLLKRTAIARADASALTRMAPSVLARADHEGFPAHGDAVRQRQR